MEQSKFMLQLAALDQKKAIIIAAVMTLLFWYFMINDEATMLTNRLNGAQSEYSAEVAKKAESQAAIAKADEVKGQLGKVGEQYERITVQLPSDLQGAEINKTIQSIAAVSGVNIRLTEPRQVVQKENLDEVPFKLQIEGTYSEVTNFLYNIATAERVMRIGDFSLSPQTSGSMVSFDGIILAYRLRKN